MMFISLLIDQLSYLHNKRRYVCICVYLFVCLLPMAGRMAGSIKTKLGMGTHVDPGSVLIKVKVIYRGPQGRDNRSSAKRDKYGGQRPARAERMEAHRAETTLTANVHIMYQGMPLTSLYYSTMLMTLHCYAGRHDNTAPATNMSFSMDHSVLPRSDAVSAC